MLSYATPFSGYSFAYDARNRQTEAFVRAIGTSWLINGLGQRIAQINVSVPEFFFVYDEAGRAYGPSAVPLICSASAWVSLIASSTDFGSAG
jgi:hypothetical protein